MLPLILTPNLPIGLSGCGDALERRRALLVQAGVTPLAVPPDAGEAQLGGLKVLFVAGLEAPEALAARARAAGVLVNVEDKPALCDFHVPALLRRGGLLLTVSTGGKAPGLSRLIRQWLERHFALEWDEHLSEAEQLRRTWQMDGLDMAEISRRLEEFISKKGWLT